MNCLEFTQWLENRDVYGSPESEQALRHADICDDCGKKLAFDNSLEEFLHTAMKPVEMPQSLMDKVNLSLENVPEKSSGKKYALFGAVSAVLAALVVFFISIPVSPTIKSMDELGKYVIENHGILDLTLVADTPSEVEQLGDIDFSYNIIRKELPARFQFVGARICPLGECESVHLVYLDNGKRISVYLLEMSSISFSLSSGKKYSFNSGGQEVSFWKKGNFVFALTG